MEVGFLICGVVGVPVEGVVDVAGETVILGIGPNGWEVRVACFA